MSAVSRDDLHRTVQKLPTSRLAAAAELLESLKMHDERVRAWRRSLTPAEESEIAASLRREYTEDEWITDDAIAGWIDALATDHEAPNPRHSPR
jgi:hypothetical protein